MQPGQVVKVVATDPGSERDFQVFMQQSGNKLIQIEKSDGKFYYWIQKSWYSNEPAVTRWEKWLSGITVNVGRGC